MKGKANQVKKLIQLSRFDLPRFLRWVLVLILYLITFSALDQLSQTLQLFPGVVAWYPPDGLSLAFLLTFGAGFAPVFALASLISSLIIYRFSAPLGPILIWAVILSSVYGINAFYLHRRIRLNPRLQNLRDTFWLILTSAIVSTVLALISVSLLVNYGIVQSSQYLSAFVEWWIGEMIGVLVFTPFLLLYVMPWLKRFIDGEWGISKKQIVFRRPSLQSIGQIISIPIVLYLVFGIPAMSGFQPYYLIAAPLIWIALKNGFSRVSLAIVAMNFGIILAIGLFKFDTTNLAELQFTMFGIYTSALMTGAVVTKQKMTEEELRQREIRYRALIENAPDAITLLGADGLLKYSSPSTQRILGYDSGEQVGSNPVEFTHPDDLPALQNLLDDLGQGPGKVVTTQYRFRHKDGSWRWLESTITNLLAEPSVQAIVINFRDITERKQAEEALRESDKRFRSLYENSPVPIWEEDFSQVKTYLDSLNDVYGADLETYLIDNPDSISICASLVKIIDVNRASMELFGANDKTELLENLPKTFTPESFVTFRQELIAIWKGEYKLEIDGVVQTLAGLRRDITLIWAVVPGYEKSYSKVLVSLFDITERKQVETERKRSEALFRALFELSPDSIVLLDPNDPKVSWPIIDCNEAACVINGYTREELIGQSIDILNTTPGTPADRIAYMDELREAGSLKYEVFHRRKDGTFFPAEISTALLSVGGRELVLGIDRDITARKQAEEAIRDSQAQFEGIVSMAVEAIISIDESQRIILFNQGAERIFECTAAEALGLPLLEFLPLSSAKVHPGLVQNFGTKDAEQSRQMSKLREIQGRRRGGNLFPAEVNISKLTVKGRIIYTAIVRDVTQRKQAEEEIKISNNELSMLFELSHSLAEADNLDEILELVNRHSVESIHTTFARIALLEDGKYIMRAAYPIRPLNHDLKLGERNPITSLPYSHRILEQNEPMIIRANDPGIGNEEKEALLLDFAQSLCLIPLRISDSSPMSVKLIGLLMLGEARDEAREPFTPQKMRLAQSIGDSAAIAIRRMLLREQTEQHLKQLIALSEIDLAIISSSDMDFSLGVLLSQVIEQLEVDAADVWLFNPTLQALHFFSGRGFRTPAFENSESLRLGEGNVGRAALERRTIHIPNLTANPLHPRLTKALAEEPFICYYAVPLIVKGQVKGVLEIFHRTELEPNEEWLKFLHSLANQAAIAIDNSSLFNELQSSNAELTQAYDATILGWSRALDLRDNETEDHTQRVTELTMRLGRQLGLSEEELVHVRRGALLHDIGKMGVPDGILLKPGPLTDEEWIVMRKHPTFAYELLSPIIFLRPALDIPYCHHEKWDGTGYPRGFSGDQIPFAARIFAVVDVWDALTSDRPYRAAWTEEKVLEHIRSLAGTHFDPQVVKICLEPGMLKGQSKKKILMEPIQWSDEFSVGVKEFDQQHQHLIQLLNRLIATQVTISTHSETISDILLEMSRYAQTHFETEERLMEAYSYPGLEKQKMQHRDFRKKAIDFSTTTTLATDQIPEALLEYLADWLTHHILEDDMEYRSFFKDKGFE